MLNFGFPRKLNHDRGKEFDNNLLRRLQELSNVTPSQTTLYHPQGNGQCESFNRTIINMLKTLPENPKNDWPKHVKKLTFAYNSTVNKLTGFSPFFLLFGRHSILPIDYMFDIVESKDKKCESYPEFVEKWHSAMKDAYNIASKHINTIQSSGKKQYNQRVYGEDIGVGDRVLLKNVSERGGTGKLRSFWEETVYKIMEKKQGIPVFVIVPENGEGKSKTVHKNLLMKCQHLLHNLNHDLLPSLPPDKPVIEKKVKRNNKLSSEKNIPDLIDESDSETEIELTPNVITTLSHHNSSSSKFFCGEGIDNEKNKEPLITNDKSTDIESATPNSIRVVNTDQEASTLIDDVTVNQPGTQSDQTSESVTHVETSLKLRRSSRNKVRKTILTYNELGKPGYIKC